MTVEKVSKLKAHLLEKLEESGSNVYILDKYIDYVPGLQNSGSIMTSKTDEMPGTIKEGKFIGIKPFASDFSGTKKVRGMGFVETSDGEMLKVSLLLLTKAQVKEAIKTPNKFHGKTFEDMYPNIPKKGDTVKIVSKPFLMKDGTDGNNWVFLNEGGNQIEIDF